MTEVPNVTATEILNAVSLQMPVHGIISDMLDREIALLGLVIEHKRLTPAECLALWKPRD